MGREYDDEVLALNLIGELVSSPNLYAIIRQLKDTHEHIRIQMTDFIEELEGSAIFGTFDHFH